MTRLHELRRTSRVPPDVADRGFLCLWAPQKTVIQDTTPTLRFRVTDGPPVTVADTPYPVSTGSDPPVPVTQDPVSHTASHTEDVVPRVDTPDLVPSLLTVLNWDPRTCP